MAYEIQISKKTITSVAYTEKENVIERWRNGELANKILVKANGRNAHKKIKFLNDIHYQFCDLFAFKEKRKNAKVFEVYVICNRQTGKPSGVSVRNATTALFRPGMQGLYEIILAVDKVHHERSGECGLLYEHPLYENEVLCADLRLQLGLTV